MCGFCRCNWRSIPKGEVLRTLSEAEFHKPESSLYGNSWKLETESIMKQRPLTKSRLLLSGRVMCKG